MVFFNLIYQGYTQDHQRILKIGLGAYLGVVALIFSGKLPENVLESKAGEFFKSYGWLLVLIDYLVLNLLHYFQTGQYLFRQNSPAQYRPHYVAWQSVDGSPQNYLEDRDTDEDHELEDRDTDEDRDTGENREIEHEDRVHETKKPNIRSNRSVSSNSSSSLSASNQPMKPAQPFVPRPELLIPTGLQTGGSQAQSQAQAQAQTQAQAQAQTQTQAQTQARIETSEQPQIPRENNLPPFDPNYTIDDDQNVSMNDDQDYFEDNQEPQIIDNYAMSQSTQVDDSESISD